MNALPGTQSDEDPALEELKRIRYYRQRPIRLLVDYMGVDPKTIIWSLNDGYENHNWDSTIQFPDDNEPRPCPNPIAAFLRAWFARDEDGLPLFRQIAIESANSCGKTFSTAAGSLAYLDTHRPSIVRVFAPTAGTLEENMFGEVGKLWNGLNGAPGFAELHPQAAQTKDLHVYMKPDSEERAKWAMTGYLAEVSSGGQLEHGAESAAGAHGSHAKWMTLVVEEATGVDPRIWNALDFTRTALTNQLIAFGNPDSENDPLHDFWQRPSTLRIRISGFDHPNYVTGRQIVPGGFGRVQEQTLLEKFNGNRDHPMFRSRARGICPRVAGECLFEDQAIEAVQRHFRSGVPSEGERWDDYEWKDPLFHKTHTPDVWEEPMLRLARATGWGDEALESSDDPMERLEDRLKNQPFGLYDVDGYTKIYELPETETNGRYVLAADVAADHKGGDAHAAFIYDRVSEHMCAEIHLRGPREIYALTLLALTRVYAVPLQRDLEMEESRQETLEERGPAALATELYLKSERKVRDDPAGIPYPLRRQAYPKMIWETNGVGALHKIGPFRAYPNLFHGRNPNVAGSKPSKRMGHQTTSGKRGTRKNMVESLRSWGYRLGYEPQACPSERLLSQMQTFKKNTEKDRYEAETGCHDDAVMAAGIALYNEDQLSEPAPAKKPDPRPQTGRKVSYLDDTANESLWDASKESVFTKNL